MRRAASVLATVLLAGAAPPPGASSCTGCHAAGSGMGALAGMPAASIEAAMQGFRDGSRKATLMNRIAAGFTPAQTQAIALWFEQQR
jgi:sulfide dehydrogenase cytochrome subunit